MEQVRTFQYWPGPPGVAAFIQGVFAFIPSLIMAWVFIGSIIREVNTSSSQEPGVLLKVLLILVFLGFVTFWFLSIAFTYFRRPWLLTTNLEEIIAERLWGRDRVVIRWLDIVRVTKVPQGRIRTWPFIQVEALDGRRILIGTHLMQYQELLHLLRQRAVNCQVFDAYTSMRDKA